MGFVSRFGGCVHAGRVFAPLAVGHLDEEEDIGVALRAGVLETGRGGTLSGSMVSICARVRVLAGAGLRNGRLGPRWTDRRAGLEAASAAGLEAAAGRRSLGRRGRRLGGLGVLGDDGLGADELDHAAVVGGDGHADLLALVDDVSVGVTHAVRLAERGMLVAKSCAMYDRFSPGLTTCVW